jgi:hypothetical protein
LARIDRDLGTRKRIIFDLVMIEFDAEHCGNRLEAVADKSRP